MVGGAHTYARKKTEKHQKAHTTASYPGIRSFVAKPCVVRRAYFRDVAPAGTVVALFEFKLRTV